MPNARSAGRISIRPLDDLFEPTVEREQPVHRETLPTTLSPDRLRPFPNHPFKVVQDEAMRELVDSVRENGVIEPILCRPDGEGGYQIVSGHRRQTAAMLAGLPEVPVTVREMDDHTATIVMVDSNLHRPTILPSEKAFAFKMKLAALEEKRAMGLIVSNGRRSTEMVGEKTGDNYRNVMRYLRLTELTPELLALVDSGKLSFHPAVELSYLKPAEQEMLHTVIAETILACTTSRTSPTSPCSSSTSWKMSEVKKDGRKMPTCSCRGTFKSTLSCRYPTHIVCYAGCSRRYDSVVDALQRPGSHRMQRRWQAHRLRTQPHPAG